MKRAIIRIGNVADIGRGSSPRPITDKRYFENGEIPWIKIADATSSGKYIYKTKQYVNDLGASYSRKMKPGTLILSASGSLGIPYFLGVEGCIHDGWIYMDNIHDIDKQYLYYLLLTMRPYFENLSYGAAIQNINTSILSKTKIEVPNIQSQEKIGLMLSAYDNLIENNNKRIKLLEQMADSLYKEWFVRFRFPGYENEHFIEDIPLSWSYVQLGDIASFDRGISYSSDEINCDDGVNLINLKNIQSYGGFRRDGIKRYNGKYKDSQIVVARDLILGVTDMTQDRRTVGSVALIPPISRKSVISADLVKVNLKVPNVFFYCMCRYGFYSKYFSQFANGANVLHLKPNVLLNKKILLPPVELIEAFAKNVRPMIDIVDNLNCQNDLLTKQRDMLLPRLMSGKLEV
jgi:type I restriction enzyme, S subunit